ncbi:MAG TPA: hypothetical protein VJ696_07825, partial [Rhodanobacteraceae bacterium]|nr:hypothetical protein [Rhodanobacteraceae bacterium]
MHDISKPRHARGFAFAAAHSARGAGDAPFPAFASSAAETWTLAIALGILYVAAIASFRSAGLLSDEAYHYAQIELFRRGEFRVLDLYLTTIPGYHALVAALLAITGSESLAAARTLTALFGLAAAAAFHLIRRETQRGTESIATAELLALPVLAPFLFLVYTDVLALALILWATLATLRGRHVLAAIALCATVLVRQNDVVWAGFLAALAVWPAWQERGFADPKRLAALLAPYLVPVGAFLAFWIWNGSISLSHEQAKLHPELGLHTGNLLLAILAVGVLCGVQVNACARHFIAM